MTLSSLYNTPSILSSIRNSKEKFFDIIINANKNQGLFKESLIY